MPRPALLLALALVGLAAAGCGHPIDDGTWRLTQVAPVGVDTCGLLPSDGSLGQGRMHVFGNDLRFSVEMPAVQPVVSMLGRFKHPIDGQADAFTLAGTLGADGTLAGTAGGDGAQVSVGGVSCVVTFGQTEIVATVESFHRFSCSYSAHLELAPTNEKACPTTCDFTVGCSGDWQSR